jgi:hypothetical protein
LHRPLQLSASGSLGLKTSCTGSYGGVTDNVEAAALESMYDILPLKTALVCAILSLISGAILAAVAVIRLSNPSFLSSPGFQTFVVFGCILCSIFIGLTLIGYTDTSLCNGSACAEVTVLSNSDSPRGEGEERELCIEECKPGLAFWLSLSSCILWAITALNHSMLLLCLSQSTIVPSRVQNHRPEEQPPGRRKNKNGNNDTSLRNGPACEVVTDSTNRRGEGGERDFCVEECKPGISFWLAILSCSLWAITAYLNHNTLLAKTTIIHSRVQDEPDEQAPGENMKSIRDDGDDV